MEGKILFGLAVMAILAVGLAWSQGFGMMKAKDISTVPDDVQSAMLLTHNYMHGENLTIDEFRQQVAERQALRNGSGKAKIQNMPNDVLEAKLKVYNYMHEEDLTLEEFKEQLSDRPGFGMGKGRGNGKGFARGNCMRE